MILIEGFLNVYQNSKELQKTNEGYLLAIASLVIMVILLADYDVVNKVS
jgi:hypothetical protein